MRDTPAEKQALRQALRQQRRALRPEQQRSAAQALCHWAPQLPSWKQAQRVALYLAADGEIDPSPLAQLARQAGMETFLPVIDDTPNLQFAAWDADSELVHNRFQLLQPVDTAPTCDPNTLDIVFLPLVGWDQDGNRLGMGGGFYDRSLAGVDVVRIGLAHSCQEVTGLPTDHWDIRLDHIVTASGLYTPPQANNG